MGQTGSELNAKTRGKDAAPQEPASECLTNL
jgi:hypothetical protein